MARRVRAQGRIEECKLALDSLRLFQEQWNAHLRMLFDYMLGVEESQQALTAQRHHMIAEWARVQRYLRSDLRVELPGGWWAHPFRYLLKQVNWVSELREENEIRTIKSLTPHSENALVEAISGFELEIEELKAGPPMLDPLDELVERLGVGERSLQSVANAEANLAEGDDASLRNSFDDCRRALEQIAIDLARALGAMAVGSYGDALNHLVEKGLIDKNTQAALQAKDISGYGWISKRGPHPHEEGLREGPDEARFAIEWTRAQVEYLLRVCERYRDSSD